MEWLAPSIALARRIRWLAGAPAGGRLAAAWRYRHRQPATRRLCGRSRGRDRRFGRQLAQPRWRPCYRAGWCAHVRWTACAHGSPACASAATGSLAVGSVDAHDGLDFNRCRRSRLRCHDLDLGRRRRPWAPASQWQVRSRVRSFFSRRRLECAPALAPARRSTAPTLAPTGATSRVGRLGRLCFRRAALRPRGLQLRLGNSLSASSTEGR
ncbi:MAG: hypothetical protein MZV70_72115 [Desulfobacterales bacterium]|nr:hypothetical protein [Desulfobacterales bacterium]